MPLSPFKEAVGGEFSLDPGRALPPPVSCSTLYWWSRAEKGGLELSRMRYCWHTEHLKYRMYLFEIKGQFNTLLPIQNCLYYRIVHRSDNTRVDSGEEYMVAEYVINRIWALLNSKIKYCRVSLQWGRTSWQRESMEGHSSSK
jgi:hypothetical protein